MSTNRHMTRASELRVSPDGSALTGYAATFDEFATGLPFKESLDAGCFTRSLEAGGDVIACVDHNPERLLGRTASGTLKLDQDERGLRFDLQLDKDIQLHRDTLAQVERGDLAGCSFAFNVVQDEWTTQDGQRQRRLQDVDLIDVSVCCLPAYDGTSVSLRSDQTRTKEMNDTDIAAELNAAKDEQRSIADKDVEAITADDEQRFDELGKRVVSLEKNAKWMQRRGSLGKADTAVVTAGNSKEQELRDLHRYLSTGQYSESRTQAKSPNSAGGYLVPTFWSQQIYDLVREMGSVMGLANVQQIQGDTNFAMVTSRPSFDFVAEGSAPADSEMVFSSTSLGVKTLAGRIPITRDLLSDSIGSFNESYLQNQMAVGLSESMELRMQTEGAATATAPAGISTAVAAANQKTAAGASAVTAADVFSLYGALGPQYRSTSTWLVSPSFLDDVRALTSGTAGSYIWTVGTDPGIRDGYSGFLLGRPVVVSTYLPATTTGNTVAYFGDFSQAYLVGMRGGLEIVSDPYTLANQRTIAVNMWQRFDTAVLNDSALANLTMA